MLWLGEEGCMLAEYGPEMRLEDLLLRNMSGLEENHESGTSLVEI